MSDLVLVTGATGKTGGALMTHLLQHGVPHRAASRHGAIPFDWEQPSTWEGALDGVSSVYLVAPGTVSDPYALMIDFLVAATRTGHRRFVLLSMAGLPAGGPAHGQVHQWLQDNSDDWAVLCPSAFMQNFSAGPSLATIRDEAQIYSNTGDGRVPFIDANDIGAVAFAALTAQTPPNVEVVLTGDEAISYDRVAELISEACGHPVVHTRVSTDAMVQRFIARGLSADTAAMLAFGYEMIAAGTHDQTADGVLAMTGRAPNSFEAFARSNAEVWRPAE